jgi:acyl carrier protein
MSNAISHDEICNNVVHFISENLLAEGVPLNTRASLTKLGLDSFSLIEILLFVERKFGIAISMDKLNRENTETVEALAGVIQTELGAT